ncbi:MAG: acetate--CoA ligase family protein [Pseudonocardiaceae bacterium]
MVVPVLLQRAATDEAVAVGVRDAVARLRSTGVAVPIYVCWVAPRSARANAELLQESGVPCFEWPERTARALSHAVQARGRRSRHSEPFSGRRDARSRHSEPFGGRPQHLDPDLGARMLRGAGVGVVESVSCSDVWEAVDAAERLGYPVVCKVVHPDLVHRSDVGGVRLNLTGPAAARTAARALFGLADGARVQVQPQLSGIEVAVGGLRDPQFGPVVMIGLGGILVEVMGDVAFGLAPLQTGDAHRLIASLRGYPVLTGARGREPVDLDALAGTVSAVGDLLVTQPEIVELDLNPLLATASGAVAVDWRITVDELDR